MGVFSAEAFSTSSRVSAGAPTPASPACLKTLSALRNASLRPHTLEGNEMNYSPAHTTSFKRGEHRTNIHLQSNTNECSDWLKHQLRNRPAKEIANDAGVGQRAAEGIKAGRNGLTMAHLVTMCRANADFRAQFFAFCGGQLEGSPELVANLSKAINAIMQQQGAAE